MSTQQFETMIEQLRTLTANQLLALQNAINSELAEPKKQVITEEEAKLIYSLFS